MYLENIEMINYGAIKELSYKLPFNEDKTPQPVVLVGRNGVGKTLLLSNIIHSLIELKRGIFDELKEVNENKFYRVGAKDYIRKNENYAYINYSFSDNQHTDLMVYNYDKFKELEYQDGLFKNINIDDDNLKKNGFYSNTSKLEKEIFDKNVYIYFPVDRYYMPTWLNKENTKIQFNVEHENFVGKSNSDMIRDNILEDVESWILDVIIDKMLYEQINITLPPKIDLETKMQTIVNTVTYNGKNNSIQNNINKIINEIFKNSELSSYRIGIGSKKNREIVIIGKNKDGKEIEVIPKFSNLSSGEVMILSIFTSILKEYDRVTDNIGNIKDISGIVLIDEIDLHLHSDFAKEILPNVIKMFPKIQFIVSSHSPFFLLGMNQCFGDKCKFLSLPNGVIMNNVENFEEIQKCYEMLDKNHSDMAKKIEDYEERIKLIDKPLIITEGKTDWKHIKNALNMFKEKGEFSDLDIFIEEYEYDMGEKTLDTLLDNLARVKQSHKIIGIFDNDSSIGEKYLTIKEFGNNVFGYCIPRSSEYKCGISIEMLYKRNEMQKEDENGRRLYLSDEFNQKNKRLKTNNNVNTNNINAVKEFYSKDIIKIIDSEVFDESEKSIALTKEDFAMKVLFREKPFDNMNVDNFRGIFDTIKEILKK